MLWVGVWMRTHWSGSSTMTIAVLAALAGTAGCRSHQQQATPIIPHAHIYPEITAAPDDIANALTTAGREHKRVLLDFGGDWCGDCQVLNAYLHQPRNAALLHEHFVLVDVNVGRIDQNLDIGTKYGVNLKKGVPALAVLQPDGQPVYGQSGQFADMRHMEPSSVQEFLEKWQ